MGSKARVAKEISKILNTCISQNNISTYIEPFVGGANMIENIICEKRYGLDINDYIIDMWKALQNGYIPPENVTKSEYEAIRDNKEEYPKELVSIVGFCTTYNAKWFGGYAGIVHTKIGTDRNYYDEAVRNILNQLPKVKDVKFMCKNYNTIKLDKLNNALVYCDPPYANTTKYKDDFNHVEFWDWVREALKNNFVFVSEYNAPNDFRCIWEKQLTTTLDKNSRKTDIEKLFVYTP